MRIIPLSTISLDSSTIAENLYGGSALTKWTATTFSQGNQVYYDAVEPHMVYEAVGATSAGDVPGASDLWSEIGTTDRWAMFDDFINTYSAYDETFTVEVDSSNTNVVGLFGLTASEIELTQTNEGTSEDVKTETINLDASATYDWYSYFTAALIYKSSLIWEFPQYSDTTLAATITYKPGSDAKCGFMGIGKAIELGKTLYGVNLSVVDYSKTITDDNGRTYFNPGASAKQIQLSAWFDKNMLDHVYRTLLNQVGALSIFDCNNSNTNYESLHVLGQIKDVDVSVDGPSIGRIDITIQGVT